MAENQIPATESKAVVKQENIAEQVLARINTFQNDGGMTLPANYSVENHLKSAWLVLQETTDKNGQEALKVCTHASIANAMFDMVLQGLSVSKAQGYFLVYGNKLEFQRSYFGTVALAKRAGGMKGEPVANVIYEGDKFIYTIDPSTGRMSIVQHEQTIDNIDNSKIKGAYAIVTKADGTTDLTIMTMQQIRNAWNQGATKGNSPAHKNFTEEMAKKTVIGRACKMLINSSDDAWLYEGKDDDMEIDRAAKQREAIVKAAPGQIIDVEEQQFEDVSTTNAAPEPAPSPAPSAPAAGTQTEIAIDGPGY